MTDSIAAVSFFSTRTCGIELPAASRSHADRFSLQSRSVHQILHSLPIAIALISKHPEVEVNRRHDKCGTDVGSAKARRTSGSPCSSHPAPIAPNSTRALSICRPPEHPRTCATKIVRLFRQLFCGRAGSRPVDSGLIFSHIIRSPQLIKSSIPSAAAMTAWQAKERWRCASPFRIRVIRCLSSTLI